MAANWKTEANDTDSKPPVSVSAEVNEDHSHVPVNRNPQSDYWAEPPTRPEPGGVGRGHSLLWPQFLWL